MLGIVLVTHGGIGREMLATLDQIVGKQSHARAVVVGTDEDVGSCQNAILSAIGEVNSGDGVVLLTDMFGGTPSNLAIAAMPRANAVVIAGLNLPMLVKLASVRGSMGLMDAVREAEAAGRKYIQLVTENLAATAGKP